MRTLTIRRNKAYPGWALKTQVYLEDAGGELTISGVPCRLLGTLKNGEEKTFCIDCAQRQLFLIFNPKTKEKMNSSVTIPAGEENVCLSGKYHNEMGYFPFRFDGIAPTQEQQAREQAQKKRSIRNGVIGALIGTLIAVGLLALGANLASKPSPQTFSKGDFSISLTKDFEESYAQDYYAYYESDEVVTFVMQEGKQFLGNLSLQEYARLLMNVNGYKVELKEKDHMVWFSYTQTIDQMQFYYMVFCYEGDDAFWTVNFATPIGSRNKMEKKIINWAESVRIAQAS